MATILQFFRHATRTASPVTDDELLDRFAAGRDEEAFAELVRRHGPVVYRVCRRLVGPDAAEDAFQASFLVLATRLDAARAAGSVGGWLIGVAGRVARSMRRAAARRSRHEANCAGAQFAECHDESTDLTDQFRVLDEEIARLPDRLRDPVVLCLLQGRTQEQAAAELGRDARTLRRRLGRAKQVLRARLERRGVVPVVAATLVSGAGTVAAAVPHDLAARTGTTVFDFLTGGTGAARSAPVVLAKGVATTMTARKLTHLLAITAAGLIGASVVFAGDEKPVPAAPLTAQAVPAPAALPQPIPVTRANVPDDIKWARDEAEIRQLAAEYAKKPGYPTAILIEVTCLWVPAGFCERSGLEHIPVGVWSLTRRESRMFAALLRAEPSKEVVGRPQVIVGDNQTGYAQIGQDVPYTISAETTTKDGITTKVEKIGLRPVGWTLRVTPRIMGGSLLLRLETQTSEVAGGAVNLGNRATSQAFNTQSLQTTTLIPDASTFVLRTATTKRNVVTQHGDGKRSTSEVPFDQLWVMTAHVLKGKEQPPAPKPAARRITLAEAMDVVMEAGQRAAQPVPTPLPAQPAERPQPTPAAGVLPPARP